MEVQLDLFLKYRKTPKNMDIRKIAEIILKFEQGGFTVMCPKDADGMANNVDPDQEQSDLGLHCVPKPVCPKI